MFKDMRHLYEQMQGTELRVYFDEVQPSLRVGVKVGEQFKEHAIAMDPTGPKDVFKQKLNYSAY